MFERLIQKGYASSDLLRHNVGNMVYIKPVSRAFKWFEAGYYTIRAVKTYTPLSSSVHFQVRGSDRWFPLFFGQLPNFLIEKLKVDELHCYLFLTESRN